MSDVISIIVPVYNVEKYLSECVCSILNQTYKYLEIILVDDGSTDNSGKMCDEFARLDDRVRVIHQKNGGLSAARNTGIEVASGKYLAFIDSDDYILEGFIEALYKKLMSEHAEICECGFSYLKDGEIMNERLFDFESLDNEMAVRRLFTPPFQSFTIICNKLYNKELLKKNKFPVGKLHEDEFTVYKLLFEAEKVAYVNKNMYIYRIREKSIMTSGYSSAKAEAILDCIKERRAYFEKYNIDLDDELVFNAYLLQITILNLMIEAGERDEMIWKSIKKDIKSNRRNLFGSPYLKGFRSKMSLILLLVWEGAYIAYRKRSYNM